MKRLLFLLSLLLTLPVYGQSPQSQKAPSFGVNAAYVNGIAPGFAPTAGLALNLKIGPGTTFCSTTLQQYTGGILVMTASTTNYVYLDVSNNCTPTVSTSNFTSTQIPIAIVTTTTFITNINDVRILFGGPSSGGPVTPAGPTQSVQLNNGGSLFGSSGLLTDTATHSFLYLAAPIPSSQPTLDIRNPVFAGGAVCNGTSDIGPALQAAWNALPTSGGEILIPGSPAACYWANPTTFNWSGKTGVTTMWVQGQLRIGSTISIPGGIPINWEGRAASGPAQFIPSSAVGNILALPSSNVHVVGTIGTTITPDYVGATNPGATTPVACDPTQNGKIYQDTTATTSDFWTCASTTGTISAGTNQLVVASRGGFVVGDAVNITGTGPAGGTQVAFLTAFNGSTNTFTISANASTSQTNTPVITRQGADSFNSFLWRPGAVVQFTPSSMNSIFPNTWLSIGETTTCSLSTIGRTSNLVTGVFSSYCPIAEGTAISVAGVSDTSFNGSHASGSTLGPYIATYSDYDTNNLQWIQATGPNVAPASLGGTVTGFNEDVAEVVQVTQTTATTATALFFRPHTSAAQFGLVAFANSGLTANSMTFENISFTADGVGVRLGGYKGVMKGVSSGSTFGCITGFLASWGMEIIDTNYEKFEDDSFSGYCQPWSVHATRPWRWTVADNGAFTFSNTSFSGGAIKLDHGAHSVEINNKTICEQCGRALISYDTAHYWSGSPNNIKISTQEMQDNPQGFNSCLVHQLKKSYGSGLASVQLSQFAGYATCAINTNFTGTLKSDTPTAFSSSISDRKGVMGNYDDGLYWIGNRRGANSDMSPAVLPHSTENVITNPASWPGGCTTTTGVIGPDGSTGAGSLSGANTNVIVFGSKTTTPQVGDQILAGMWVYTPTPGVRAGVAGTGFAGLLDNNSSTHFTLNDGVLGAGYKSVGTQDSGIVGDWWHPVFIYAKVTASDGTAGQSVRLSGGCSTSLTMSYYMPWMMYIAASENVPQEEVLRWKAELMHGAVPPNMPAGGGILAINPIHKFYWGSDTTLYRGAAGEVKTDGVFNAVSGFKVNGSPLALANLADVTVTSATTSMFLKCTAQTGGTCTAWSPAVPAGGGTVNGPASAIDSDIVSFDGTSGGLIKDSGIKSANVLINAVPPWLQFFGDGSEAAPNCTAGCSIGGEHWYASFNLPVGQTLTITGSNALSIRSPGTCTIAGTVNAAGTIAGASNWGGSGGGGGFGAANGTGGSSSGVSGGGTGGTSGVSGGNGSATNVIFYRTYITGGSTSAYVANISAGIAIQGGAAGGVGGSSGGAAGKGGQTVVFSCGTINFTGAINANGSAGGAGGANTGGGGGGGGGIVLLRSPNMTNSGTINVAGGTGGVIGTGTSTKGGDGGAGFSQVFSQ